VVNPFPDDARLWRAVDTFRVLALAYAVLVFALDHGTHVRPWLAWVLLEDEPDRVTVTVRDDGVGMAPGRLEEAAREGRLGVQASVRGRLADVGGTVAVHSAPGQGWCWGSSAG
jgi:signal transduction histidine kinase